MKKARPDLLHGTLDLLILQTLRTGAMHGWAISKHLRQISEDVLEVGQGSLYPALYRLEKRGWIEGRVGRVANGSAGPSSTSSARRVDGSSSSKKSTGRHSLVR